MLIVSVSYFRRSTQQLGTSRTNYLARWFPINKVAKLQNFVACIKDLLTAKLLKISNIHMLYRKFHFAA